MRVLAIFLSLGLAGCDCASATESVPVAAPDRLPTHETVTGTTPLPLVDAEGFAEVERSETTRRLQRGECQVAEAWWPVRLASPPPMVVHSEREHELAGHTIEVLDATISGLRAPTFFYEGHRVRLLSCDEAPTLAALRFPAPAAD